jgi:spore coat polysaccharide biosynthesis protein SpsF
MTNLIIIQARANSSRLPKKILMRLEGKSILEHIINFSKFSKLSDKIIVATTTNSEDNAVENICNKLDVACFRGSSENVLERFYECSKLFHGDIIVRLTADNPLIDPELVDDVIKKSIDTKCDYATNMLSNTFPHHGYLAEAMSFNILEQLYNTKKDPLSEEHITYDLRINHTSYHVEHIRAPKSYERPNWRLTLDYQEDFELISKIFSELYDDNSFIKYESVVKFLDENPDLLNINSIHNV